MAKKNAAQPGVKPAADGETPPDVEEEEVEVPAEEADETEEPETVPEAHDPAKAKALIQKLREKEKAGDRAAKELEKLKKEKQEQADKELSEVERLKKRNTELESNEIKFKRALLCQQVAVKFQLPSALANRLQGETLEEIEADAKTLLESLPAVKKPKAQNFDATNPAGGGQQTTGTDEEWAKFLSGSGPLPGSK